VAKKAAMDKASTFRPRLWPLCSKRSAAKTAYYTRTTVEGAKSRIRRSATLTIALVYFNRSDLPKATEEYQTVLKSNPKDGPAHFYMGMIYRAQSAAASKEYQSNP